MSDTIYLIDANSLITPHLTYYPFDFAPGFWDQIEQYIKNGRIAVLDLVKNEILQGNDRLKEWMDKLKIKTYIDHRDQMILEKYCTILQHLENNPCYKPSALHEWSKNNVADPWFIATAIVYKYTLVTFEISNKGLNNRNPSKNAKIPDIAEKFQVKTINLFDMMRALEFHLR